MTTQPPSQSKRKEKQTRRLWTPKEEDELLLCMLNCVSGKFRADNGFKSGFFVTVEKELQKHLPGTTLKANPNIEFKVKNWKEKYGIIADAICISGFQWNHDTKSIEVDDESVWEEYEKMHPKAKGMNGKRFPMFDSWQILFGKDRATGEMAEDPQDIPDGDDNIGSTNFDDLGPGYVPLYENGDPSFIRSYEYADNEWGSETANPSTPTSANPSTPTNNATVKPPKKKAKLTREMALHDAMASHMAKSNAVLEKIAEGLGYEKELATKRVGIIKELLKLDLNMNDMFKVNEKICQAEERVDTFYALPDEMKFPWVMSVLDGRLYGNN